MQRIALLMSFIAMVAMSVAVASCSKSPSPSPVERAATSNPLEDAIRLGEVVPIASGGAYLVSMSSVYYVSGEKVVAVSGLPKGLLLSEVEPLADGTAILKSQFGNPPALYLLRASKATVILETTEQLTGQSVSSNDGFLFASNQRLRRALKVTGTQATKVEPDSDANDDPRH